MGDVVNLRRARKQRDRRVKEQAAQTSRVAHGRSKSEREATATRAELENTRLDGHKRERDSDDPA
ncbi:MAG: DUF4169 family protein [Methylocystis sp.]|uniref:DUF4169 family protein n=1 Tax=Methylocystis sp. TaxID=1911079 RepID=UPI003D150EAC